MIKRNRSHKDQTIFVDQAPLWQKESQKKLDLKANLTGNKNLRPFYFLIAGGFLIAALYIIGVLIFKRDRTVVVPEPVFEKEILEAGPLQIRVQQLQEDLKEADPTRQTLAFPNINLEISFP
jgi:hypothetical protein